MRLTDLLHMMAGAGSAVFVVVMYALYALTSRRR
jgi:hypothetical protein